jgi:integrase
MKSKKLDWDVLNTYSRELIDAPKDRNDYIFGIYVQIALRSGLRVNDILTIRKSDVDFNTNIVCVVTKKTNKPFEFELPKWLIECINNNKKYLIHEQLFYNEKYKGLYSVTWINLRLKKQYGDIGVSSHSIRKSVGMKIYNRFGVNGARAMLTHSSLKHTSTYLELDTKETLEMQKQLFVD